MRHLPFFAIPKLQISNFIGYLIQLDFLTVLLPPEMALTILIVYHLYNLNLCWNNLQMNFCSMLTHMAVVSQQLHVALIILVLFVILHNHLCETTTA